MVCCCMYQTHLNSRLTTADTPAAALRASGSSFHYQYALATWSAGAATLYCQLALSSIGWHACTASAHRKQAALSACTACMHLQLQAHPATALLLSSPSIVWPTFQRAAPNRWSLHISERVDICSDSAAQQEMRLPSYCRHANTRPC
jgi:hypothetical protein